MTEEQCSLLDDMLADSTDRLDDWQVSFIESLDRNRSERNYSLSSKQEASFNKIAVKLDLVCGKDS